jgi:acetyltransferase-like isoleucine patch superfamily enzyme
LNSAFNRIAADNLASRAKGKKEIRVSKTPLVEQLHKTDVPLLKRYQFKVLGNNSFSQLLKYELITFLFGNISGGLGYVLRKWSYGTLFKKAGRGIIFGKGIAIRHPGRISLGHRVAIDDYSMIDASGVGDKGIVLCDDVIVSRGCVIQGKTGSVTIEEKTDIGCNTIISSVTGVFLGKSVLIAGNCYIGGARYISERIDLTMMDQGIYSEGPVVIGDDVWLGAGVLVLDGVRIGKGCIVGAGAVVTKDLPDYAIAVGVPAAVVKSRSQKL